MPRRIDDLDLPDDRLDDRWTLTKLYRAGYEEEWTRTCRTCGDEIACFRHRDTQRRLILDDVVWTPHDCAGPRGYGHGV